MSKPQPALHGSESPPGAGEDHAERVIELYRRYHDKLVRSLVPRTRSIDEARDIAAQAFAQLLSLDDPRTVNFFGAYLYRTARNLAEDRLRHRAMQGRKAAMIGYEPLDNNPSPERMLAEEQRVCVLLAAIARLRPRCRMAVILRIWEELPYDEVVARFASLGVEVNERTVRRYVAEAFECCREAILKAEGTAVGGTR